MSEADLYPDYAEYISPDGPSCDFPGCDNEAEVRVTIPMAGERPSYLLCHDCLTDLDPGYMENVEPLS